MTTIDMTIAPILEYDPSPTALIEPTGVLKPLPNMPERVVLCFFREVIEKLCGEGKAEIVSELGSEIGKNQIYALDVSEGLNLDEPTWIALAHPGVGAPLAAGYLDELIALGGKKFVACGGAGVLNREIAVGHLVIPESAVRDEGTSYHYLPPSREVQANADGVQAIKETLEKHDLPYVIGKTWTTDAIYRETKERIARRRAEGCITVEMEASAFFAVATFRDVPFGQLLYGGDDVSGDVWDHRGWHKRESTRERVFWLAAEAALRI